MHIKMNSIRIYRINDRDFLFFILLFIIIYPWNEGYGQRKGKTQKQQFKKSIFIAADIVAANIETYTTFQGPYSLLMARVGLEQNLGLTKSKVFFSGNIIWRITKRSGIFASYYWIHRGKQYTVKNDIPYLNEYLPKGTQIDVHFNTNVLNIGYLLTFVDVEKAFLSGYFNIYIINLKTGVKAPGISLNKSYSYFAPVPNFGLYASFEIAPWLELSGKLGLFYLRYGEYTEKVNDVSLIANFKPAKWLGVHFGYKAFEVYLMKDIGDLKVAAEYHFQGPAVGLNVNF